MRMLMPVAQADSRSYMPCKGPLLQSKVIHRLWIHSRFAGNFGNAVQHCTGLQLFY